MLAIHLLRLYNGEALYETIGRIGTPGLCILVDHKIETHASQWVLDNKITRCPSITRCPLEPLFQCFGFNFSSKMFF